MARLNHCKAGVDTNVSVYLQDAQTGEIYHVNADVLKSYSSSVAAVDTDGNLYLLPRYGYSQTTYQHLRKFITDFEHMEYLGVKEYVTNGAAILCSAISWDGTHFWPY